MGNMRIWLIVAGVGLALVVLNLLAGARSDSYFMFLGVAGLIVGAGGALWDTATKADRRSGE